MRPGFKSPYRLPISMTLWTELSRSIWGMLPTKGQGQGPGISEAIQRFESLEVGLNPNATGSDG